jgi:hypothetical protein
MLMRVIAGPDGWVHTLIEQDAPKGWQPPAEPYGAVIAARPEIELPLLFLTADGHLTTPHDDDAAWLRYREMGYSAESAMERAMARPLGQLPDVPLKERQALRTRAQALLPAAPAAVRDRLRRP